MRISICKVSFFLLLIFGTSIDEVLLFVLLIGAFSFFFALVCTLSFSLRGAQPSPRPGRPARALCTVLRDVIRYVTSI